MTLFNICLAMLSSTFEGRWSIINQSRPCKVRFFAHLSTYLSEWSVNTMLLPVSNISTILSYNNNLPRLVLLLEIKSSCVTMLWFGLKNVTYFKKFFTVI